jgi:hypothetical protein
VEVSLKRKGTNGIEGEINIHQKVSGRLIWQGKEIKLTGGHQLIVL